MGNFDWLVNDAVGILVQDREMTPSLLIRYKPAWRLK